MNWNKTITFFLILAMLVLCIEAERKIANQFEALTHVSIEDITPEIDLIALISNKH